MKIHETKVPRDGVLIPADVPQALQVREAETLGLGVQDGECVLFGGSQALKVAQQLVKKYKPLSGNVVDELLDERRKAAQSE